MAEDTSAEDRTEEPSSRRLTKAREEGESAHSKEVPAAAVLIAGAALMVMQGDAVTDRLRALFISAFSFDSSMLHGGQSLPGRFGEEMLAGFIAIAPLLVASLLAALLSSGITGGFIFSLKAAAPQFGKINPLSGIARMFSMNALVELLKSVVKLALVGSVIYWCVNDSLGALAALGGMALEPALLETGRIVTHGALLVTLSLVAIAVLDAFYQRYTFAQRMRMSKQEVRDEMKDSEGRPEIKAQIRRRQREIATVRMLERIKDADVVITNPEHFAVALSYDPSRDGAPTLIAKGTDEVAFRLIAEARRLGVQTFEAPPLARAIYFTTRTGHAIREELYYAVAQVIAYVMNLHSFTPDQGNLHRPIVTVPSSMRFATDGTPEPTDEVA